MSTNIRTTSVALAVLTAIAAQAIGAEKAFDIIKVDSQIADLAKSSYTDSEQVARVNGIVEKIIESSSVEDRSKYLAQAIAMVTWQLKERASPVIGPVTATIPDDYLAVVSASAVLSAGANSPSILKAIVASQEENDARIKTVMSAAKDPLDVLDVQTAEEVQNPATQTGDADSGLLSTAFTEGLETSFSTTTVVEPEKNDVTSTLEMQSDSSTPPRPPAIPPRPPAMPYRGQ